MPIVGTPVGSVPYEPGKVSPVVTNLFEVPVPTKKRSISIQQGNCTSLRIQLFNESGDPVDMSEMKADGFTAAASFRECLMRSGSDYTVVAAIEDTGSTGFVSFTVPNQVANNPGIYILEVALTDDTLYPRAVSTGEIVSTVVESDASTVITTNLHTYTYPAGSVVIVGPGSNLTIGQQLVANVCLAVSNTFTFSVERGLFGIPDNKYFGPPSLAEIRLHLRDYPECNLLLDDYEFDAAEITLAIERCVMYFNETLPPISRYFDTKNFPYRYHWLEGISYYLFTIAANWFRRNRLPYQAGGVSVDDTGKEKEYLQAAAMFEKNWKDWVRLKKYSLNIEEGFDNILSDYSYR